MESSSLLDFLDIPLLVRVSKTQSTGTDVYLNAHRVMAEDTMVGPTAQYSLGVKGKNIPVYFGATP